MNFKLSYWVSAKWAKAQGVQVHYGWSFYDINMNGFS